METLQLTAKEGYTIVQLNRGKANPINKQMVDELRETFKQLEADASVGGIILTGTPNFFSAGLDVVELFGYNEEEIKAFMIAFGLMHREMVQFSKPFICVIPGHCPAGGTVLAITADYRIMIDDDRFSLGLNEMKVNVQISKNLVASYSFWLGKSLANRFVLEGRLLKPQEGLAHNLLDEVVPAEALMERAEKKMKQFLMADPDIFAYTKGIIRKEWIAAHEASGDEDLEQTLKVWWKPEIRQKMEALINSFKKK